MLQLASSFLGLALALALLVCPSPAMASGPEGEATLAIANEVPKDSQSLEQEGSGSSTFGAEMPNPEDDSQQPTTDDFWEDFEGDVKADQTPDPLQPWNEAMFEFNDFLYYYALKPAAQGWKFVVPEKPRRWVSNFFRNLASPVRFMGCLLQGKLFEAGVVFSRFVGNTAFGLGGLADVTGNLKPTRKISTTDEDLGQTLGIWGFANGPYIVWPVVGPSTIRDSVGYAGDSFLDVSWYLETELWQNVLIKAGQMVNDTSLRLGEYEALTQDAVDPYAAVRDAYMKFRAKQLAE
jgi:phospholipid-binding lipoprotein MlaA